MPAPRYKLLVDTLTTDIRSGRLPAGTRLPTHRALAARHEMAVVTASRVYRELAAAGLVSTEQGRGTFVRDVALPPGHGVDQPAVTADSVDLTFNHPTAPGQADQLRGALRDLATTGDLESLLRYQPHGGRTQDRAVVAAHLAARGLPGDPGQVLLVSGAQHGLAITLMATLQAGDVVAVDALTYPGFIALARTLGLELAPIPVSQDGPDLDALDHLCATRRVRAVYAMPTMHNPLGAVMDLPARTRLVDTARRHGLLLVEDASYAYLAPDAPPPLAALAPETTVHVTGLSKSVATGLRVGFVAAPAHLVPALERAIRVTTWNTPALTTTIACRWLRDGTVDDLEARKRADATTRQTTARHALRGRPYLAHPSSYFGWLPLPDDARADRIATTLAEQHHISVATARPFTTTTHAPQAIRLALATPTPDQLEQTLTTITQTIDHDAAR